MAELPHAAVRISAFSWVPPFARGQVRDLRVRWALEEVGVDYQVRAFDPRVERLEDYYLEQPFGQVPSYADGEMSLFETGAIVLHIGERHEALLPRDRAGRARATAWVIAALNSVEPFVQQLISIDIFDADAAWGRERRPEVVRMIEGRLDRLVAALGGREHLENEFTAGDLLMASVLNILNYTDLVERRPTLAAYRDRCLSRPAYSRALAAQLATFDAAEAA